MSNPIYLLDDWFVIKPGVPYDVLKGNLRHSTEHGPDLQGQAFATKMEKGLEYEKGMIVPTLSGAARILLGNPKQTEVDF